VRKGERALTLCMPVTCKRQTPVGPSTDTAEPDADQHAETFTRFVYRPKWFVLSQTDGQPVEPPTIPEWDQARALDTLAIVEEPFTMAVAIGHQMLDDLLHRDESHRLRPARDGSTTLNSVRVRDLRAADRPLRHRLCRNA
jgi:hypothetical protein